MVRLIQEDMLESELHRMERIIDQKAADLDKENYEKYIEVFERAIRYLKTRPVLLYGGLAIHEVMPPSLKIYGPYTLPDIDVFSYKAGEVAKDLVKYMKKHGYDLSFASEALHPGTTKIYSQGQQIADITYIPKEAYRKLSKGSIVSSLGIKVVNPQYLRMSLHKLLAFPNLDRWPKVLKRIVNFYSAFPPPKCNVSSVTATESKIPEELLDALYDSDELSSTVFMGAREVELITEKDVGTFKGVPPIIAVVDGDVKDVATKLVKNTSDFELVASKYFKPDLHSPLPGHVIISYKRKPVALLFEAISCFTYNEYRGRKIASLHSILFIYLSILGSTYDHFDKMIDSLECIANAVSWIHLKTFASKKVLFQQFAVSCFGPQEGIATLRRARQLRKKQ